MAKIKPTNIGIKGKLGENVYVDSGAYGYYVRSAPVKGSKKDEPAFKAQLSRTKYLNHIASHLNRIIEYHYPRFKSNDLYQRIQKRFRKEPLDIRFLLLAQLKEMEINPAYPLNKLGHCRVMLKKVKRSIMITLQVLGHPPQGKYRANCYYYELLLLTWDNSKRSPMVRKQLSEWIYLDPGKPEFEFEYPLISGTTHWLICLRQCLGVDEKEIGVFVTEGIQIADVGTFDKLEQALLEKKISDEQERRVKDSVIKPVAEPPRVKAKRAG